MFRVRPAFFRKPSKKNGRFTPPYRACSCCCRFIACSVIVSLKFSGAVTLLYSGLLERISIMAGCAWVAAFSVRLLTFADE